MRAVGNRARETWDEDSTNGYHLRDSRIANAPRALGYWRVLRSARPEPQAGRGLIIEVFGDEEDATPN
jgi:hypothetical protein